MTDKSFDYEIDFVEKINEQIYEDLKYFLDNMSNDCRKFLLLSYPITEKIFRLILKLRFNIDDYSFRNNVNSKQLFFKNEVKIDLEFFNKYSDDNNNYKHKIVSSDNINFSKSYKEKILTNIFLGLVYLNNNIFCYEEIKMPTKKQISNLCSSKSIEEQQIEIREEYIKKTNIAEKEFELSELKVIESQNKLSQINNLLIDKQKEFENLNKKTSDLIRRSIKEGTPESKIEALFIMGDEFLIEGSFDKALKVYDNIAHLDITNYDAYIKKILCYFHASDKTQLAEKLLNENRHIDECPYYEDYCFLVNDDQNRIRLYKNTIDLRLSLKDIITNKTLNNSKIDEIIKDILIIDPYFNIDDELFNYMNVNLNSDSDIDLICLMKNLLNKNNDCKLDLSCLFIEELLSTIFVNEISLLLKVKKYDEANNFYLNYNIHNCDDSIYLNINEEVLDDIDYDEFLNLFSFLRKLNISNNNFSILLVNDILSNKFKELLIIKINELFSKKNYLQIIPFINDSVKIIDINQKSWIDDINNGIYKKLKSEIDLKNVSSFDKQIKKIKQIEENYSFDFRDVEFDYLISAYYLTIENKDFDEAKEIISILENDFDYDVSDLVSLIKNEKNKVKIKNLVKEKNFSEASEILMSTELSEEEREYFEDLISSNKNQNDAFNNAINLMNEEVIKNCSDLKSFYELFSTNNKIGIKQSKNILDKYILYFISNHNDFLDITKILIEKFLDANIKYHNIKSPTELDYENYYHLLKKCDYFDKDLLLNRFKLYKVRSLFKKIDNYECSYLEFRSSLTEYADDIIDEVVKDFKPLDYYEFREKQIKIITSYLDDKEYYSAYHQYEYEIKYFDNSYKFFNKLINKYSLTVDEITELFSVIKNEEVIENLKKYLSKLFYKLNIDKQSKNYENLFNLFFKNNLDNELAILVYNRIKLFLDSKLDKNEAKNYYISDYVYKKLFNHYKNSPEQLNEIFDFTFKFIYKELNTCDFFDKILSSDISDIFLIYLKKHDYNQELKEFTFYKKYLDNLKENYYFREDYYKNCLDNNNFEEIDYVAIIAYRRYDDIIIRVLKYYDKSKLAIIIASYNFKSNEVYNAFLKVISDYDNYEYFQLYLKTKLSNGTIYDLSKPTKKTLKSFSEKNFYHLYDVFTTIEFIFLILGIGVLAVSLITMIFTGSNYAARIMRGVLLLIGIIFGQCYLEELRESKKRHGRNEYKTFSNKEDFIKNYVVEIYENLYYRTPFVIYNYLKREIIIIVIFCNVVLLFLTLFILTYFIF